MSVSMVIILLFRQQSIRQKPALMLIVVQLAAVICFRVIIPAGRKTSPSASKTHQHTPAQVHLLELLELKADEDAALRRHPAV